MSYYYQHQPCNRCMNCTDFGRVCAAAREIPLTFYVDRSDVENCSSFVPIRKQEESPTYDCRECGNRGTPEGCFACGLRSAQ